MFCIYNSKKRNTLEHQQAISILEAGKCDAVASKNLISALDRGGLWQISPSVQKLLLLAEKYYRLKTKDSKQRKTNSKKTVQELMNFSYVKEFFNEVVSKSDALNPSEEVSKNVLMSILSLYIQVRSFSYARDIVQKERQSKSSSNKKALRKELSHAAESKDG